MVTECLPRSPEGAKPKRCQVHYGMEAGHQPQRGDTGSGSADPEASRGQGLWPAVTGAPHFLGWGPWGRWSSRHRQTPYVDKRGPAQGHQVRPRPHPSSMAALRLCVLETSGSRSGDGGDAGRDPRPDSSLLGALRSHHPSGPPCPRSRALQAGVAGWEAPVCSAPFLLGLCQDAATAKNQEAVWECEPTSLPCLEKGLTLTEAAGCGGAEGLCHPPPGRGFCLEPQLPPAKRPGEPSGLCGHSDKPRHEVACDPGLHGSGHLHGMAGARGSGAPCPGRPGRDLAGSRRTPSRPL